MSLPEGQMPKNRALEVLIDRLAYWGTELEASRLLWACTGQEVALYRAGLAGRLYVRGRLWLEVLNGSS